jgi:anti-sigma regulatory factor (Ser/Thr protein kinase)/putative methionine-R-sulfoxide reductase with GAF domain
MADDDFEGASPPAATKFRQGHVTLSTEGLARELRPDPAQLADLYRLSDPALAELPFELLLDELLVRVKEVLSVDTVAVLLRDDTQAELVARAAKGLEEEVRQGVRIPIGKGFAGHIAADRAPVTIPDLDSADVVNPILAQMGIRSLLGVPLIVEGELIGVMHVGSLTPRTFTVADAALLELVAGRVAPDIERARLFDALEREHRATVALQRSLLPDAVPDFVDVETAVRYRPARDEVGGDWYDVMALPHDMVGIVIGDVVGHGVRAAALMAQLRTATRAYALDGHPPGVVLERLDRFLQATHSGGMATVAFAPIDPAGGALCIANAGHLPPVIVSAGSARVFAAEPNPPIGVRAHPVYRETGGELAYDETVLLYTDGLVEVRGEPVTEGIARLVDIAADGDHRPEPLCDRLLEMLPAEGANDDDIAVVALNRPAPPGELELRLAAEPQVLAPARRRLRAWLRARGSDPETTEAIVLAAGEACANAIEHAYPPVAAGFEITARLDGDDVEVAVRDAGRWREARGRHRGRGLGIMRAAMDAVDVRSTGNGTEVVMRRRLRSDG